MSLRSFASWKNLLIIGSLVLAVGLGVFQFESAAFAQPARPSQCSSPVTTDITELCRRWDTTRSLYDTLTTDAGRASAVASLEELGRQIAAGATVDEGASAAMAAGTAAGLTELAGGAPPVASGADSCGDAGDFTTYICQGITMVLGMIVTLLGWIVALILTVLLAFAKYNSFSSASVVEVGWPIVRDICNMFFIVILLISAFGTIIDQQDLHYTKVLPKLLLMAVLINFSKTLIQLLIDFSQVVMLTFVNAFASAATGNFVNALGLTDIMRLSADAPAGAANGTNIIIAYMLAIFMLGITISVVTIMTAFLIFRIVGLWIALIMSPLAFFATAIPGRLSKSLGSIGSDYWSRLGSLLSGGPIIAFFLWLTLAVVQGANASGGGLSSALSFDVPPGAATFITSIGDAQSIASFIVGITLLMMGLDQAVKSAGAIGGTIGASFAARAKGAGMAIGRLGAVAPFLAAGYAARGGARALDRRLDITGGASRLGLRASNALANAPIAGAFGGRALRSALRPTLAKGLTMRRKEAAEEAGVEEALLKKVGSVGTDAELKLVGQSQSFGGSAFRTLGARAASMKAAEVLSTDKLRDRESKRNEAAYVKRLQASGMSEADAKSGSKVLAEKDAQRQQTDLIQKRLSLATSAGDQDTVEEIEKAIKASPMLASDEKREKIIEDLAKDPDKYKDISKQDSMNGEVLTGFMLQHGYVKDASGALTLKDAAAYDRLKDSVQASGNKSLVEGLEAHESFVANSPGLTVDKARTLQHRKNAADSTMQSFDVSKGAKGNWAPGATDGTMQSGTRVLTANYTKAEGDLKGMAAMRKSGITTTPLDNADVGRQFISNNGTVADFISKGKISDTDTVPIETLSGLVQSGTSTGFQSLANGNISDANSDLQVASGILKQIGAQGVDDKQQIQLISAFTKSITGSGGTIDASFIKEINRLHPDIREAITRTIEVTKKRADDLVRSGGTLDAQQKAVVNLSDAISKQIETDRKKVNRRIVNAYTEEPKKT